MNFDLSYGKNLPLRVSSKAVRVFFGSCNCDKSEHVACHVLRQSQMCRFLSRLLAPGRRLQFIKLAAINFHRNRFTIEFAQQESFGSPTCAESFLNGGRIA
jgi:hypothetical protein